MVDRASIDAALQRESAVRCEWGPTGASALADETGCLVVVDVLSFTTAVSVAVGRGTAVYPCPLDSQDASEVAERLGAALAVRRGEVTVDRPWSLSPVDLMSAPVTRRLVLPSPNGAVISSAARGPVVAACLRNAAAVCEWLLAHGFGAIERPAIVVPAGERWPDGSMRPALEDALGAGAVLGGLRRAGCKLSPEAASLAHMWEATQDVAHQVRRSASGLQLASIGYGGDVEAALAVDVDTWVPLRVEGPFEPR